MPVGESTRNRSFLNGTSTMHIERDIDEVLGNGFADNISLFVGRKLKKLLAKIVAKGIYYSLEREEKSVQRTQTYPSLSQQSDQRSRGRSCHGALPPLLRASFGGNGSRVGLYTMWGFRLEGLRGEYQRSG